MDSQLGLDHNFSARLLRPWTLMLTQRTGAVRATSTAIKGGDHAQNPARYCICCRGQCRGRSGVQERGTAALRWLRRPLPLKREAERYYPRHLAIPALFVA